MKKKDKRVFIQQSGQWSLATVWHELLMMGAWCLMLLLCSPALAVEQHAAADNDTQVMGSFTQDEVIEGEAIRIATQEKHVILFVMGLALLLLVLSTAVLGVAMAIYGKQVFIAHMVVAGLSVTLALAHAVVAVVWFFPF